MAASNLAGVLLAAIVGGAAGWLAGTNAATSPPPTPTDNHDAVVSELQRLGEQLRGVTTRPATTPTARHDAPRSDATPATPTGIASGDNERLLMAIEQLLARVEQIATRQTADNGTLQRLAAERPVDTGALDELQRHIDQDWTAAQRQLFMMPMAVVLQRFGPPSYVNTGGAQLVWIYEYRHGDGRKTVSITFHDGVVVKVD